MTNRRTENTMYIIGAGAIGKALAVILQQYGKQVVLVRASVDDGGTCLNEISVELGDGKRYVQPVTTVALSAVKRFEGTVILANKSFGNEWLARKLARMKEKFPIVILQNGLGVENVFVRLGCREVYRCVLFATSQVLTESTVRFRPVSVSPVGVVRGHRAAAMRIVSSMDTPDFEFCYVPDIQSLVWKKTIMNTVFNSVCPLLETDNGIFYRDKVIFEFARRIVKTCVGVAHAAGIEITVPEVEDGLLQISKASDGQLISTLQDIRHGRRTEIETLNFEIAGVAESLGMQDATREVALLGELIKMKADVHRDERARDLKIT